LHLDARKALKLTDPFDAFVTTREPIKTPFVAQATTALARGWFPIPVKGKDNVPKGVTGARGKVDSETVAKQLITRERGYDNLAVRHDGTISIDVDVRGEKNGVATMAKFCEERGLPLLPPTYSSTARGDDSPSRQYFYRLPTYVRLASKPRVNGKLAEDVEICQYHHRYSVVYPSVHPETQTTYMWYLPGLEGFSWGEATTEMPHAPDLPELPPEWIEALSKTDSEDLDFDADVVGAEDLMGTFRDGEPSPPVRKAIEQAQTQHPGHDATYTGLYNAFMYGRERHPGVKSLVTILIARHQEYLESEHPDRAAKGEVEAIIKDASEKAQQTPVTNFYRPYNPLMALGQMTASSSPGTLGFTEPPARTLGGLTPLGAPVVSRTETPVDGPEPVSDESDPYSWVLPAWVWEYSEEMAVIRQAALSRQVSPDVVLHACLATLSSLMHHESRLETGKGPTVLSYYAIAVGSSGGGKTEGLSCADDLLQDWKQGQLVFLATEKPGTKSYVKAELGSGEGMVEAYMDTVTEEIDQLADDGTPLINDETGERITKRVKTRKQVRHNAMFASDEGRQMLAIAARSGSTVMSTLCSMWSGVSTGAANAKTENSRTIEKGTYVLGMLLGFQPATMEALFDDTAGGAPQRFAFANTAHPDITADEVDFPRGLSPKLPMKAAVIMTLSDKHRRMVREFMAARARGDIEVSPLDGHRVLLQCRTAALLALLHSQTEVTDETWNLAETVVETSCKFRDHLATRAERERAEQARRKAEMQVHTNVASAAAVSRNTKLDDTMDWVVDQLGEAENKTLKRSAMTPKLKKSLRPYWDEALDLLESQGRIVREEVDNSGSGPKRLAVIRLTDGD
jgi:hypothetical protein